MYNLLKKIKNIKWKIIIIFYNIINKLILNTILFFPVIIILCLIKLLYIFNIKIRLGKIDFEKVGRIYSLDFHLSLKKNKNYKDYFFLENNNICNKAWYKLWSKNIKILYWGYFGKLLYYSTYINKKFSIIRITDKPQTQDFYPKYYKWLNFKKNNGFSIFEQSENLKKKFINKKKNIYFEKKDIFECEKILNANNIKTENIICFHARDNAYLKKVFPDKDWQYHNYRNSCIEDYKKIILNLKNKNYTCIRMGLYVEKKISFEQKTKIIDYSNSNFRCDILDLYLIYKCKFFISGDCGITAIAEAFRKKIVFTNFLPIRRLSLWVNNAIVIFKKIYIEKEKRFMPFSEVMNIDFDNKNIMAYFSKNKLTIINNSSKEIYEATKEMHLRINNAWDTSYKDEELQNKFWDLFDSKNFFKSKNFRISSYFLKKNKELIN